MTKNETTTASVTAEEVLKSFPFEKFPKIRPAQDQAIRQIHEALFVDGKRFAIFEGPAGVGKSNIGMAFARHTQATGNRTYFLTIQNLLVDQYGRDFPPPEMEFCKGRSHFPCTHEMAGEGMDASRGVCKKLGKAILPECVKGAVGGPTNDAKSLQAAMQFNIKPEDHLCPYWAQLTKCVHSPIVLFNFSSFLFQKQMGRFPPVDLLLIDEAHNIEGHLQNFITLTLSDWDLAYINKKIDRKIEWKKQLVDFIKEKNVVEEIGNRLEDLGKGELDLIEKEALENLKMKLAYFTRYLEKTDWAVETLTGKQYRGEQMRKIVCRPIYVKDFADDLLFSYAKKVIFMSATILDKDVFCRNLGIQDEDASFIQADCDFPVERRPIILDYAGNQGFKHFNPRNGSPGTRGLMIEKVKELLAKHPDERGIIHSHSHERTDILRFDIGDDRFLFQTDFPSKPEMLEEHARRPNTVIVAPAMHEGLDLKGDLGRFQILLKVPYPSTRDKVISIRMNQDQDFYSWLTALKLIQSYGRCVRSKDDHAVTYIIDQGFQFFMYKNRKFIPGWVREAIQRASR